MAEALVDGMEGHFCDDLLDAFPEPEVTEIRSALSELKAEGLVTLTSMIGPKLPNVHTTLELFVACDPVITGHAPMEDAAALAGMLVEEPGLGHVPDLEAATGWPRRRFNPALGLLKRIFPKGRYREVDHPDYPTLGLIVDEDMKLTLRRYMKAKGQW
jgi:hypothetical protein